MRYIVEESLSDFKFWSGAKDRAYVLTKKEFDQVEDVLNLEAEAGRELTDDYINNLFWFNFEDLIWCDILGHKAYKNGDHLVRSEDVIDPDSDDLEAEEFLTLAKERAGLTEEELFQIDLLITVHINDTPDQKSFSWSEWIDELRELIDNFREEEESKEEVVEEQEEKKESLFIRVMNAILDGGKNGVDLGLQIIPGVLIISTLVMMITFGPKDAATGYATAICNE